MKKAIYLDERERDLARRLCDWVHFKCQEKLNREMETDVAKPALRWFDDEIDALRQKFEEEQPTRVIEQISDSKTG